MPIPVPSPENRRNLIAYLSTLIAPGSSSPPTNLMVAPVAPASDGGDWRHAAPGVEHFFNLAALPAPYSTTSAGSPLETSSHCA
jgi:hypothetical protein